MGRMFAMAAAACLLCAARADEPQKAAPGHERAASAGKAAEAEKKDAGGPAARRSPPESPAPKAEAKPEQPKPCEPVRPCPID